MKKMNRGLIFTILSLTATSCSFNSSNSSSVESSSSVEESTTIESSTSIESSTITQTKKEKYNTRTETSLIPDYNFANGFKVMSPHTTDAHLEGNLDYNGTASKNFYQEDAENTAYWLFAQWWTPYDFINATYSYNNETKTHKYENESRLAEINSETGKFRMRLDAYEEYNELYGGRRPSDKSWSHYMISSDFPTECQVYPSTLSLDDGDGINFTFDITIDEVTFKGEGEPYGTDCAQLMMYILLTNRVEEGSNVEEVGRNGDCIWFGLPIYDSRYKTVPAYKEADSGFEGATNHLIWNLPSAYYMPSDGVEFGTKYHVDFNVLEYLGDAFVYGVSNGFLANCKWQNMAITYMNFSWEIPGQYLVDSTVENLDIYVSHNNEF